MVNLIFPLRELFSGTILKNLLRVLIFANLNSHWKKLFSVHVKFFLFQYFLQFHNFSMIQVCVCFFLN